MAAEPLLLLKIFGEDIAVAVPVILNLILIESLLSVDNAAVLATMVMDLPKEQRARALKYGILGAYFFRGLCLLFAVWLVKIWWLKPLGGLYLLFLSVSFFVKRHKAQNADPLAVKKESWIYRNTLGLFGKFWATVILVEVMDLAFSLDNVLAAVAYTDNIVLICIGVFIGILAMRFVAQGFVKLMERYPHLATAAFVVVGILGLKLMASTLFHFYKTNPFLIFLESHEGDLYFSLTTVFLFFLPVLWHFIFPPKPKA
jgi:YkoY family integral membrane protein